MDGLDAIVFTGGIGENADDMRATVCKELTYLGIKIDEEYNSTLVKGKEGEISTPDSKVKVFVLPTNEELVIARDTRDIVNALYFDTKMSRTLSVWIVYGFLFC